MDLPTPCITPLALEATREEVLLNINALKIKALNYSLSKFNHPLAEQNLDIREAKQLTDLVLTLEDSLRTPLEGTEGSKVRLVQKLLDKYATD